MKKLTLLALLAVGIAVGQAPDNTKANQKDRVADPTTADKQSMNKTDAALVKKIREAVYADKSLSTYAHNVKIIVRGGEVTLKGPVRTPEERDSIQQKAASIAGAEHVANQLEVAPKK
jgi:osmotically-inducible protein OsmY